MLRASSGIELIERANVYHRSLLFTTACDRLAFVVDVGGMMRRSDENGWSVGTQVGQPRRWPPVPRGRSRSRVAGFAPDAVVDGRSRRHGHFAMSLRPAGLRLLVGVLSSLAVGCAGTQSHTAPAPAHVGATPPADLEDVVIQGDGPSAVPVAAPRVGERFLNGYVAFLYGHGSAGELEGATRRLRRELRRGRVRVPPARGARTPTIVRLQSAQQAPATVVVTAIVDDGDLAAYPVTAVAERRAGRWQVTRLTDD
jgi:hypothetical protein